MNDDDDQHLQPRIASAAALAGMKRRAQARDRALVASGAVPPDAMLLLRRDQVVSARVEWPEADALDP